MTLTVENDITLHQGVSKEVKVFPGLKVSDSLKVIFPGTSKNENEILKNLK